jgi:hypothetical protein
MDFIELLRHFTARVEKMRPQILNEEMTKNALIMPFFQQVFGYDVFNLDEFVPEFSADVGVKKGERVDYAIIRDGKPAIIIECKCVNDPLDAGTTKDSLHQLFHYFVATPAKFGILTNGVVYKFYTDLNETHKMDLKPFLELDLMNIRETLVPELKRFCKSSFNADEIFSRAAELKYSSKIKSYFLGQLNDPSDDFVKFMLSNTYDGMKTATVIEKFRPLVKNTLNNLIEEMMKDRINAAINKPADKEGTDDAVKIQSVDEPVPGIVTTEEELQAFYTVKAILSEKIDAAKITYEDALSYFAVQYCGSRYKWICRFEFRASGRKTLTIHSGTYNPKTTRAETAQFELQSIDDIFKHKDELIKIAIKWDSPEDKLDKLEAPEKEESSKEL